MILKTLYIRFYKSFNYDYLRKHHRNAVQRPWEMIDKMWYPYVQIPIDSKVTTVVGANESGKSHLLSAIKKGIYGEGITYQDFCRYSKFFTVRQNELRLPDFGFEFSNLTKQEREEICLVCSIPENTEFDRFFLFRTDGKNLCVYIQQETDNYKKYEITDQENIAKVSKQLPNVFELEARVAVPGSIPIKQLVKRIKNQEIKSTKYELIARQGRAKVREIVDNIFDKSDAYISTKNSIVSRQDKEVKNNIESLITIFNSLENYNLLESQKKEYDLVFDLICKIANIDPEVLLTLADSLAEGKEGHANSMIAQINTHLSDSLNLQKWWTQDKDFGLLVSAREHDLVFTIRDRTGTEYSFEERSNGLKYFLSYYIQYRAHKPHPEKDEILLMDEPDAYLSSQAQQDLLKIFEKFSNPDKGKPIQVIYVTHSPFLIDRNHAERIRVLDKGKKEEGTRVVKDVARNHYEPLRSAFGAFLGETTFIGNCNLMVEGVADQILIAGASTHLFRKGASKEIETLDLNQITIVPTGSASHIPYMVYLARGRDKEQPAVIVLLDSDEAGNNAKKALKRGGANRKELLKESFILQIGDLKKDSGLTLPEGLRPTEIEDLIPLSICVKAAQDYAKDICQVENSIVESITESAILEKIPDNKTIFKAIKAYFKELSEEGFHIDKVGFARNVVESLKSYKEYFKEEDVTNFEKNFKILFSELNKRKRQAEKKLTQEHISQKKERLIDSFLQDHPTAARREQAIILFEELEAVLLDDDNSVDNEGAMKIIDNLRSVHQLGTDIIKVIEDYESFQQGLKQIKYLEIMASQEKDDDYQNQE
ncbi:AAA family ATPase [Okeania sp. SIO2B3]|uniref:AAA family ATPase n=1 Tax=Okeania sp. SIO2B3 TaxID=2607784 RepID=UPI0013BF7280|nr:AAA family ATPase [Okeania sp. SIO2B3]NET44270.1 AAA family ATPase [Okeania sp. SIO2B3]